MDTKALLAAKVFALLQENEVSLIDSDPLPEVEIFKVSNLVTQIRVKGENGAPRYFNVRVSEMM